MPSLPLPLVALVLRSSGVVMAALLVGTLLAPRAHADTIYQYRDAQGHLVLSDQKPPASARQVKVHDNVSSNVNGPSPAGASVGSGVPLPTHGNSALGSVAPDVSVTTTAPATTGDASLDAFNRRQAARAQDQAEHDAAVARAQAALDQARADQKAGQELKPEEQTYVGYAETYEQRQQGLADRVTAAQAALLNAQAAAKP